MKKKQEDSKYWKVFVWEACGDWKLLFWFEAKKKEVTSKTVQTTNTIVSPTKRTMNGCLDQLFKVTNRSIGTKHAFFFFKTCTSSHTHKPVRGWACKSLFSWLFLKLWSTLSTVPWRNWLMIFNAKIVKKKKKRKIFAFFHRMLQFNLCNRFGLKPIEIWHWQIDEESFSLDCLVFGCSLWFQNLPFWFVSNFTNDDHKQKHWRKTQNNIKIVRKRRNNIQIKCYIYKCHQTSMLNKPL